MSKRKIAKVVTHPQFDDTKEYAAYWKTRTPAERLAYCIQLRRERHGAECDRPIAKVVRIIKLKDYLAESNPEQPDPPEKDH